jgi:hypothetical protein
MWPIIPVTAPRVVAGLNIDYLYIGDMPKDGGKPLKLQNLIDEVKEGETSKKALLEKYGAVYVRTYRGIDEAMRLLKKPKVYQRREAPKNMIWFGKAGQGKTWDAEQVAIDAELSMFKIGMKQLKQGWYDGYAGEDAILYDDFRGASMEPHEFLNLLDGLERLPIKGSFVENTSRFLLFTRSDHPINWWPKWYAKDPNNWEQVKRRLNVIYFTDQQVSTATDKEEFAIYKNEIETVKIF